MTEWRTDPLLDNDQIWAFGCSFTWGEGVDINDVWVSILSNLINEPIVNLGICGASPLRVWQTYTELRKLYTPKLTIIQWPGLPRHTIYDKDNNAINLGLWNADEYPEYKQQLVSGQIEQQNLKLIAEAKTLIVEPAYHYDFRARYWPFKDLAEDGLHPGPQTHKQIALDIYSDLIAGPAVHTSSHR